VTSVVTCQVNRDEQRFRVEYIDLTSDTAEMWFVTVEQRGYWTSVVVGEWCGGGRVLTENTVTTILILQVTHNCRLLKTRTRHKRRRRVLQTRTTSRTCDLRRSADSVATSRPLSAVTSGRRLVSRDQCYRR